MPYSCGPPKKHTIPAAGFKWSLQTGVPGCTLTGEPVWFTIRASRGGKKRFAASSKGASVFHRNCAGYGQRFGDGKSDGRLQDTSSPQQTRSTHIYRLQGWILREVAGIRAGQGGCLAMLVQHMERRGDDHACELAHLATTGISRRTQAPALHRSGTRWPRSRHSRTRMAVDALAGPLDETVIPSTSGPW